MPTQAEPKEADAALSKTDSLSPVQTQAMVKMVLLLVALLATFWPILVGIYGSWFDENAYMEHGLLVVPAAAYMAWDRRSDLKQVPPKPSSAGVWLLLFGAFLAVFGIATQWYWFSRMALLVSLVGCMAVAFGWTMVRTLSYPLGTLLLMITPPTFIFERLTLSLQLLASRLGEICLEALGFSVFREGNILELVGMKLSVEEACSGIRSLLAILFFCALYNYFFVKGRGMRILLLVAAVPIAILGNAARIVATGIASQYHPQWVSGAAHEAFGYVSVLVATAGCILTHLLLLNIQRKWRHRG
jgi:exosortase